jgi:hypothetical protein
MSSLMNGLRIKNPVMIYAAAFAYWTGIISWVYIGMLYVPTIAMPAVHTFITLVALSIAKEHFVDERPDGWFDWFLRVTMVGFYCWIWWLTANGTVEVLGTGKSLLQTHQTAYHEFIGPYAMLLGALMLTTTVIALCFPLIEWIIDWWKYSGRYEDSIPLNPDGRHPLMD